MDLYTRIASQYQLTCHNYRQFQAITFYLQYHLHSCLIFSKSTKSISILLHGHGSHAQEMHIKDVTGVFFVGWRTITLISAS